MKKLSISQRPGAAASSVPISAAAVSSAAERQKLFLRSIGLLPVLARRGVAPCDALAVAFNAVFLFYNIPRFKNHASRCKLWGSVSKAPHKPGDKTPRVGFMLSPRTILQKYSYAEIASLCEYLLGTAEFAVNKSFKEELP